MSDRKLISLNYPLTLAVPLHDKSMKFTNGLKDCLVKRMTANIPWVGAVMLLGMEIGPTKVLYGSADAVFFYPLYMQPAIIKRQAIKLNRILRSRESIVIDFTYNGYVPPHYLSGTPFELSVQFEISQRKSPHVQSET